MTNIPLLNLTCQIGKTSRYFGHPCWIKLTYVVLFLVLQIDTAILQTVPMALPPQTTSILKSLLNDLERQDSEQERSLPSIGGHPHKSPVLSRFRQFTEPQSSNGAVVRYYAVLSNCVCVDIIRLKCR